MLERRILGRECHTQLQRAALREALAGDTFDLTLRGDADFLQKLAQFDIEAIFVHGISPGVMCSVVNS
ncbi:protein of unknown function [Methylorubrum extorquens]|uniref:Uncharacterized protein n=1 Tax=Methylorubrum extorquens TaxID=408 RepID=A0A2N9AVH9_METEX|nr:protein of unknown function [Methylorubrum extorquens]